jgi:hypothetical protein
MQGLPSYGQKHEVILVGLILLISNFFNKFSKTIWKAVVGKVGLQPLNEELPAGERRERKKGKKSCSWDLEKSR